MIIVVMGVCSCGKTLIGEMLAEELGLAFYDADDFHSAASVEKMNSGIALDDDDRLPWLRRMAQEMPQWKSSGGAVLACSGLKEFGEDKKIDRLIRKYGYIGTDKVLQLVREDEELQSNLSAAAHLIHGSSEGRFKITYCPSQITKEEIESVNFAYADLNEMLNRYDPKKLKEGFNTVHGEEIFFVSNPGLGLWSWNKRFK